MTYTSTTGKGGHHRVYKLAVAERGLSDHITEEVIRYLKWEYPEDTRRTLRQLNELIAPRA